MSEVQATQLLALGNAAPLVEDGAAPVPAARLVEALLTSGTELEELLGDTVATTETGRPSALEFARMVGQRQPVLMRSAVQWPALERWKTDDYLVAKLGDDRAVTVAVTPDGYADAVHAPTGWLAMPLEERLTFRETRRRQKQQQQQQPQERQPQERQPQEMQAQEMQAQEMQAQEMQEMQAQEMQAQERQAQEMQAQEMQAQERQAQDLQAQQPDTGVYYVQLQNSNLTSDSEFAALLPDVDQGDVAFASEALGREPEAVNIWIGTSQSVTSLHKDHYENLYVVVTGEKHFVLYPPSDFPFLYERDVPSAHWTRRHATDQAWELQRDEPATRVPWIAVDPITPDFHRFPRFAHAHPKLVTVRAGDMLYVPSLWYHHVRQSNDAAGRCIAVNYWWDMDFGEHWANYQTIRELTRLLPQ